jgi:hypothetical protein
METDFKEMLDVLPMTRFERAAKAYISEYGSERFNSELEGYLKLSGKTIYEIAYEEVARHGVYDVILLHRRVIGLLQDE